MSKDNYEYEYIYKKEIPTVNLRWKIDKIDGSKELMQLWEIRENSHCYLEWRKIELLEVQDDKD